MNCPIGTDPFARPGASTRSGFRRMMPGGTRRRRLAGLWRRSVLVLAVAAATHAQMVGAPERRLIPALNLGLVQIQPGTFVAGSPKNEVGRGENEGPQTEITITRPYWLGETEVTQRQWKAITGRDQLAQARLAYADNTRYLISGREWLRLRDFAGVSADGDPTGMVGNVDDDVPIILVSWNEAVEFCKKLTAVERAAGRVPGEYEYRLPTEAEWEYACRAGTTTSTYAGEMEIQDDTRAPVLNEIAWYAGNSAEGYTGHGIDTAKFSEHKKENAGLAGPRRVATKRPNAWGVYDMLGNVAEWCLDYGGKWPGGRVRDWQGPATGTAHIRRGGGWSSSAHGVRAAYRNWHEPTYRWINLGFRVALAPILPAMAAHPTDDRPSAPVPR